MARNAPGKHHRKGMTLEQLFEKFPDNATAEQWFIGTRWTDGVHCPKCDSVNIQERKSRKPQPYRCRDCRKDFSVKTGTLMEGSNLGFKVWARAFYLMSTGIKGTSSMKLHRDLGITQKTAWHLAHRIRETWADNTPLDATPHHRVSRRLCAYNATDSTGHLKIDARTTNTGRSSGKTLPTSPFKKGFKKRQKKTKQGGKSGNFVFFSHFSVQKKTKKDNFFLPLSMKSRT